MRLSASDIRAPGRRITDEMKRLAGPVVLTAVVVLALRAACGGGSAATGTAAKNGVGARLQAFGSCAGLLAYTKQHALPLVGPWGFGGVAGVKDSVIAAPPAGRAAETPGVDYSTTNVQEEGVDEPHLVKSNGSTLFVVRSDRLFAVDVRARKPRLAGSLQLPQTGRYELLLHGGWSSRTGAPTQSTRASGSLHSLPHRPVRA